jgi:hypothetical protein
MTPLSQYESALLAGTAGGASPDASALNRLREELGLSRSLAAEIERHCRRAGAAGASPSASRAYAMPATGARRIYVTSLAAGIGVAFVLYFVIFDHLSETMLATVSPLWVALLAFGAYGLIAEHLWKKAALGQIDSPGDAAYEALAPWRLLGLVGMLVVLPLFVSRARSSLTAALVGSAIWLVLLLVFFVVVFPNL